MSPSAENHRWFALRTRSNFERMVASALRGKGYEEFLPLYWGLHRRAHSMREIELPLFPGYVFCRFDVNKRLPILVTPGVVLIVGIGRAPYPVEDSEIAALQSIVKSGLHAEPWPFLKLGQSLRIDRGALEGVEGILVGVKKPYRLVVSVTLLQRSVAVEIDFDCVTPIPSCEQPRHFVATAR